MHTYMYMTWLPKYVLYCTCKLATHRHTHARTHARTYPTEQRFSRRTNLRSYPMTLLTSRAITSAGSAAAAVGVAVIYYITRG